jgi:sugar phosphate permease
LAWLALVRESDVRRPVLQTDEQGAGAGQPREIREIPWYQIFTLRRWWLLLITVVGINVPWHALRVWMPDTLRTFYGYDKTFVDNFTSIYYLFAFVGSLAAGWLTAWLAGRGWNVHRARLAVFGLFAVCVLLLVPAQWLSRGWALLGLQLVAALGTLGLAPLYYSFNQELSGKAQGKVGGSLSFLLWMILGAMQANIGTVVKTDPTWRPVIFAVVALLPLIAWGALVLGWGTRRTT